MKAIETLTSAVKVKGGAFIVLIDPDRTTTGKLIELVEACGEYDVDAILVGSSFVLQSKFHRTVSEIKAHASIPVILFPGAHSQISPSADAVLFTSLISGRNPQYLIDEQMRGAPLVKEFGIEPIPTGYMLIDSGRPTSVGYMSNTIPLPCDKPDIACAHALAAEYMGMATVFLEAGSGAENPVPDEIIRSVSEYISIPVIVGGGIRNPETVEQKISAGASMVVVGNHFEQTGDFRLLDEFSRSAHPLTGALI